jgi:hypothetical protein
MPTPSAGPDQRFKQCYAFEASMRPFETRGLVTGPAACWPGLIVLARAVLESSYSEAVMIGSPGHPHLVRCQQGSQWRRRRRMAGLLTATTVLNGA